LTQAGLRKETGHWESLTMLYNICQSSLIDDCCVVDVTHEGTTADGPVTSLTRKCQLLSNKMRNHECMQITFST